jgi:predicted RNase H-like HicB family nuclease
MVRGPTVSVTLPVIVTAVVETVQTLEIDVVSDNDTEAEAVWDRVRECVAVGDSEAVVVADWEAVGELFLDSEIEEVKEPRDRVPLGGDDEFVKDCVFVLAD